MHSSTVPVKKAPWRGLFWPSIIVAGPVFAVLSLELKTGFGSQAIGIETISSEKRVALFSALAGTSGALLGLSIATLAILVAVPDTPTARSLRRYSGWRALQFSLLTTSFDLLALLSVSLLAIVDDGVHQSNLVTGYSIGSAISLCVCGALFALILANLLKE